MRGKGIPPRPIPTPPPRPGSRREPTAAYALDVEIPGLPPLNTADAKSRWIRHRARADWRSWVGMATLGNRPARPLEHALVRVTRCSTREPDPDNLAGSAKFILDGLTRAGVILDDTPLVIGRPWLRWERARPGAGCVRIEVRACGPDTHRAIASEIDAMLAAHWRTHTPQRGSM